MKLVEFQEGAGSMNLCLIEYLQEFHLRLFLFLTRLEYYFASIFIDFFAMTDLNNEDCFSIDRVDYPEIADP